MAARKAAKEETMENNKETVYEIPQTNFSKFEEAINLLNKKAKKLGCAIVTFIILETITKKLHLQRVDDHGNIYASEFLRYERYHRVVLNHDDAPVLDGWRYLGTVDFSDKGISTYILKLYPNTELPEKFKEYIDKQYKCCDHCGKVRRRNHTFIIQNDETKEYKLVGKSCLKDFTGHKSPGALASLFEYIDLIEKRLDDLDDEEFYGTNNIPFQPSIDEFMLAVVISSKIHGFMSAKNVTDFEMTTGEKAISMLSHKGEKGLQKLYKENCDNVEYQNLASKIIEHVPTMFCTTNKSDFVHNLQACWESEIVTSKTKNIIAAAYPCYERFENKLAASNKKGASVHQGTIKERLTVQNVTCVFTKEIESYYGLSTLIKFEDEKGNIYTWFKSGCSDVERNENYNLKGTVKAHKEYNGAQETQLTRCNVTLP